MTKIVLFPYHPDLELLADYRNDLKNYEVIGIVSYKEDEMMLLSLYEKLGITPMPYLTMLESCDEVILLENYRGFRMDKYYQIIEDALRNNVRITIVPNAVGQLDLEQYDGCFNVLCNTSEVGDEFELDRIARWEMNADSILFRIDVPVIAVMGMGKNCGKFETQLLIKSVLENEYKIAAISSNALGALFGCYTLPKFMFEEISIEQKILRFNHYIFKLVDKNRVDAILICIPEGVAPFKKAETNHFGEYTFIVSSAVKIDLAILTTFFYEQGVNSDSVTLIANSIENRFGVPVVGMVMSKTMYEAPADERNIIYKFLDKEYIDEHYPDISDGEPVVFIGLNNIENAKTKIGKCIEVLEANASII